MRALQRLPRGAERPCGCKGRSRPRAGRLRSRLRRSVGGGFCRSPRGPLTRRVDESRGAAPEKGGRRRAALRGGVGGGFGRPPGAPLPRGAGGGRGAAPEKALGEGAAE